MQLEIISPDKNLFSGEVTYVQLPGIDGLFGVLQDHAPTISALGKGTILIRDEKNSETTFEVNGGVAEIAHNKVVILAD